MTEEFYIEKYKELKMELGRIPKVREFYKVEGVTKRGLNKCFGNSSYTELQELSGDKPNRLELKVTPKEIIFDQFGEMVEKLGKLPTQADWEYFNGKPTVTGIERGPHKIKWRDLPNLFVKYAEKESKWKQAIEIVGKAKPKSSPNKNSEFQSCIDSIKLWIPQRKRFNEEGYKIELRNHLTKEKYKVEEEIGDSNIDLLVNSKIAIEIKKAPNTSEYDRLTGQIVRHLMKFDFLIVVIANNSNNDRFQNFLNMIEFIANGKNWNLEIISK